MKDETVRLQDVVASIPQLATCANRNAMQAVITTIVNQMSLADRSSISQSMHIGWRTSNAVLRSFARACALVELTLQPMIFQSGQQLIANYLNAVFVGGNDATKRNAAVTKLNGLLTTLAPTNLLNGRYDYYRPLRLGTSISHSNHQGPGTLGCFVRDGAGNVMLLGNEHVMQYNGISSRMVLQPARFNGACLANAVATYTQGALTPQLDAAVARLHPGVAWSNTAPDGTVVAGHSHAVAVGDPVWKYGCASGLTRGTISAVNYGSTVPHKVGPIAFAGQYNVTSNGPFQIPGDSGSVLCNAANQVIGLLHGGRADGGAMATPIAVIMAFFGVNIA